MAATMAAIMEITENIMRRMHEPSTKLHNALYFMSGMMVVILALVIVAGVKTKAENAGFHIADDTENSYEQQVAGQTDTTQDSGQEKWQEGVVAYQGKEYLYNILFQNIEKFPLSPGCALFRTKDLNDNFVIDIPNTDGLDSKKNGAGNDLLIFLNIVLNYAHISILQYDGSFFRAHKESFSIQNQLELYYEWAKVYFIQKKLNKTYYSNIKKIMFWQQINKGNKIYHNLYVCLKYNYWMPLSFCIIMLGGVLNSLRNRK